MVVLSHEKVQTLWWLSRFLLPAADFGCLCKCSHGSLEPLLALSFEDLTAAYCTQTHNFMLALAWQCTWRFKRMRTRMRTRDSCTVSRYKMTCQWRLHTSDLQRTPKHPELQQIPKHPNLQRTRKHLNLQRTMKHPDLHQFRSTPISSKLDS